MSAVKRLWSKRIRYLAGIYYKFITFQFDAVILLYTLFFAGSAIYYNLSKIYEYRDTITTGNWVIMLELAILWAIASGTYRGFLKTADEVFLTPLNEHGKAFTSYSFRLSEVLSIFIWTLSSSALYFFMLSVGEWRIGFLQFWLLGFLLKLIYINASFVIYQIINRSTRILVKSLFYLIVWIGGYNYLKLWFLGGLSQYIIITNFSILGIILVGTIYLRNLRVISWNRWITDETNGRARNFSILLGIPPIEKNSVKIKAKSLFNGRRLLPFDEKGALLLIYYRMITRGKGNLALMLQLLGVLLGAILILKDRLLVAISICLISILLTDFLMSLWYNLKGNVWINLYPISKAKQHWAFQWGALAILLPAFLILILVNIALNGAIFNPLLDIIIFSIWLLVLTQIKAHFVYMKMLFRV